jgi:hypothetical protein
MAKLDVFFEGHINPTSSYGNQPSRAQGDTLRERGMAVLDRAYSGRPVHHIVPRRRTLKKWFTCCRQASTLTLARLFQTRGIHTELTEEQKDARAAQCKPVDWKGWNAEWLAFKASHNYTRKDGLPKGFPTEQEVIEFAGSQMDRFQISNPGSMVAYKRNA